jgi:phosphomevalonate kinase
MRPPYFDAGPLRSGDKKLGLGSSAAILVASLGAVMANEASEAGKGGYADDEALRAAVLEPAIAAHRAAQGGGSGIDVATSVRGGIVVARRRPGEPQLELDQATLPAGLVVRVLFAGVPASTPELVSRVRALGQASPAEYAALMRELTAGAEEAVAALRAGSAARFIGALAAQLSGFTRLGARAGAGIVTAEVTELARVARDSGGVVLPAGAGGGDVALYVGTEPPPEALLSAIARARHEDLGLALGVPGLHRKGA